MVDFVDIFREFEYYSVPFARLVYRSATLILRLFNVEIAVRVQRCNYCMLTVNYTKADTILTIGESIAAIYSYSEQESANISVQLRTSSTVFNFTGDWPIIYLSLCMVILYCSTTVHKRAYSVCVCHSETQ